MANDLDKPASAASGAVAAIAAMRHHRPLAIAALQLGRIANDASVWPVQFKPADADTIAEAIRLDRIVPTEDVLAGHRLLVSDATNAPQVTPAELGQLLPPLLARGTVKADAAPGMLVYLIEQVLFERQLNHTSADMVALAVALDLRENKFAPTPSEFVERLGRARSMIEGLRDAFDHLQEVRASVDDLLVAAGLREADADEYGLGWS